MSAATRQQPHVHLNTAGGALLAPLALPRRLDFHFLFLGGTVLRVAGLVGPLECTLWVDAVARIRSFTTYGAELLSRRWDDRDRFKNAHEGSEGENARSMPAERSGDATVHCSRSQGACAGVGRRIGANACQMQRKVPRNAHRADLPASACCVESPHGQQASPRGIRFLAGSRDRTLVCVGHALRRRTNKPTAPSNASISALGSGTRSRKPRISPPGNTLV